MTEKKQPAGSTVLIWQCDWDCWEIRLNDFSLEAARDSIATNFEATTLHQMGDDCFRMENKSLNFINARRHSESFVKK